MMENYVTLFDSFFLPQGIALHISMERHIKDYTLWVLCVDDPVHEVLTKLNLPNVRLLHLSKLETTELLSVKPTRSNGEYCWTLTPFAPRFVFEADATLKRVTYIDADLWFRKNPAPIFREFDMSGKYVLITDHAYAPEYDQSATSGQYCVQFMTFTREGGEPVRKWWEKRCLEWCYARFEDGKYGDQKYLDNWPEMFGDYVHVLNDKELVLAPWSAFRFPYSNSICWHFHGLRLRIKKNIFEIYIGNYPIPKTTINNVYLKYNSDIKAAIIILNGIQVNPENQCSLNVGNLILIKIKLTLKLLRKLYMQNTIKIK
jgi:hypothetical protein